MKIEVVPSMEFVPKVCGGYLRVSSPQPKHLNPLVARRKSRYAPAQENSLPRQRAIATQFHRMLEIPDPLVLFEDDQSGGNRNRKQLQLLIEWIYADRISTVLLENDSRMARDVLMSEELIQLCFNRRIKLAIWQWKGYADWDNPIHRQSLRISAVTNQLQREQTRRMSMDGTQRSLEAGRCVGSAPFGYQAGPDKKLIREASEFPLLLRMAREIHTRGCPSIAKSLELERRTGAPQGRYAHRPWRPADVQRCLQNPVVTGHIVRHWLDDRTGKFTPRESWKVYPKAHEAVMTWAEYDEVQAVIATRRFVPVGTPGKPWRRSCYAGLVRCGHHDLSMGAHARLKKRCKVLAFTCSELNCPNSEILLTDVEQMLDLVLKPEVERALSGGEFGQIVHARLSRQLTERREALSVAARIIKGLGEREASLIERFALGRADDSELEKDQDEIKTKRLPMKEQAAKLQAEIMAQEKLFADIQEKREDFARVAVPLSRMEDSVKADLIPKLLRGIRLFERSRIEVEWLHQQEAKNEI